MEGISVPLPLQDLTDKNIFYNGRFDGVTKAIPGSEDFRDQQKFYRRTQTHEINPQIQIAIGTGTSFQNKTEIWGLALPCSSIFSICVKKNDFCY